MARGEVQGLAMVQQAAVQEEVAHQVVGEEVQHPEAWVVAQPQEAWANPALAM